MNPVATFLIGPVARGVIGVFLAGDYARAGKRSARARLGDLTADSPGAGERELMGGLGPVTG